MNGSRNPSKKQKDSPPRRMTMKKFEPDETKSADILAENIEIVGA